MSVYILLENGDRFLTEDGNNLLTQETGLSLSNLRPLTQKIGTPFAMGIAYAGNVLPIEITTDPPTATPANDKGVVFQVTGGTVTIHVWDGSAWRT